MAQHSLTLTPNYVNMVEPNQESTSAITAEIHNKKSIYSYPENVKSLSHNFGKWSSWSAYSDCDNSCNKLRKLGYSKRRVLSEATISYSKFKGLQVSTRSCKFATSNKNDGKRVGSRRCIGPTHRYQQCSSLQVIFNINTQT